MTTRHKLKKEAALIGLALLIMALKITLGLVLFDRWRKARAARGCPVSVDDEIE
jgi:hypothetical protein